MSESKKKNDQPLTIIVQPRSRFEFDPAEVWLFIVVVSEEGHLVGCGAAHCHHVPESRRKQETQKKASMKIGIERMYSILVLTIVLCIGS